MMRKLAFVSLLAFCVLAFADDPPVCPPEDIYDGTFTTDPPEAFVFTTIDGPPRSLITDTDVFDYNPETGVYHSASGDCWWFTSGNVAHFVHVLPFPAMGPFPEKTGTYKPL
jgi:hypothetical protein